METPPIANRRDLRIELAVMLLAFVGPFLYSSTRSFFNPGQYKGRSFLEMSLASLLFYVTVLPILIYVVWSNNEGLRRFGLARWHGMRDLGISAGTLFVHTFFVGFPEHLVRIMAPGFAHESLRIIVLNRHPLPTGPFEIALAVLLQLANAFREEFVMRGYLITRLDDLNVRPWLTVLISALLFASYHLYEGPLAVLTIVCVGVVYATIFRATRSIWPLVVAHALWNLHLMIKF